MMTSSTLQRTWFGRLYERMIIYSQHPQALKWVNLVAFAESSFFPLPPDLMIIPMVLATPEKAWRIAWTCSLSSVLGGLVGYGIGFFLFVSIGHTIIHLYQLEVAFSQFQEQFRKWGFWIIMAKGVLPIPYKLVTIASGVAHLDLGKFMLASLITRSSRFFILSALLWRFGPLARGYMERYMGWIFALLLGMLVLGYVLVKKVLS